MVKNRDTESERQRKRQIHQVYTSHYKDKGSKIQRNESILFKLILLLFETHNDNPRIQIVELSETGESKISLPMSLFNSITELFLQIFLFSNIVFRVKLLTFQLQKCCLRSLRFEMFLKEFLFMELFILIMNIVKW